MSLLSLFQQHQQHQQQPLQPQGAAGNFRGARGAPRGGFVPGRPSQNKKDTLKFDSEYDFDAANEQFAEVLSKLQVS
jgi:hypothetical protein